MRFKKVIAPDVSLHPDIKRVGICSLLTCRRIGIQSIINSRQESSWAEGDYHLLPWISLPKGRKTARIRFTHLLLAHSHSKDGPGEVCLLLPSTSDLCGKQPIPLLPDCSLFLRPLGAVYWSSTILRSQRSPCARGCRDFVFLLVPFIEAACFIVPLPIPYRVNFLSGRTIENACFCAKIGKPGKFSGFYLT
jgi:hypothetical protein